MTINNIPLELPKFRKHILLLGYCIKKLSSNLRRMSKKEDKLMEMLIEIKGEKSLKILKER